MGRGGTTWHTYHDAVNLLQSVFKLILNYFDGTAVCFSVVVLYQVGDEYQSTWNMLATMSERAPVISSSFSVLAVGETLSDVEELDMDLLDETTVPAATAILKPDKVGAAKC